MQASARFLVRFVLVVAAFVAVPASASDPALPIAQIDARMAAMLKEWDQPGMAIALVTREGIVHEKGFGVRDLRSKQPVDERTLFGIASLSKSFAATTVAKLVADGRMNWDDPVIRHLPWFAMPRERDTPEVTLRDLLSMRSGFGSSEYTFRRVSANRTDHVRRIRFLEQRHPLRSEYLYTTDSYTAIGEVVATVTAAPWEAFAAETLWKPIGMTRTNADHTVARADSNAASPHITVQGRKQAIDWIYEDYNALPAGGVNSTAHDLALWLQFQLNDGAVNGKALLPFAALKETRTPQTPERGRFANRAWSEAAGEGDDAFRHPAYAMGWMTHTYRGHDVVAHSGGIDGFRTFMGFLPDDNIGIVVLTNADQSMLTMAAFQTMVDAALGRGVSSRWSDSFRRMALADAEAGKKRRAELEAARLKGTRPSLPLDRYTGTFADNGAFGESRVHVENGKLVIDAGRMQYELSHWHQDQFEARPRWPYEMASRNFFVSFRLDPAGQVVGFDFSTGSVFKRLK
ncbi:serine hydrolase [Peristeroidobacter soli]|uniref:serine hydrolase n=1 Tax=Peristeroidobacter soli TaxID=2497877 RepID=UPI00101DD7D4|nr:serine hydrolase [Peristeroidobacter soli]